MKKIAASVFVGFALVMAAAMFLTSCGASWADCETCRPGEESACADNGKQIPVVVNVDVDVTVEQPPPSTVVVILPPPVLVVDAGTPTQLECRTVCVQWEWKQHCDNGWHGTDHKGMCHPKKEQHKKCVLEATQCS